MRKDNTEISVTELKRLLVELRDNRPDICVRYRLVGEMWKQNFLRVILVSERGAVLNDEKANTTFIIPDLSNIMQFELDCRFQGFQPYYHYGLSPLLKEI